jgi:hypothetical protein
LSYTLLRPRDFIQYLNECQFTAIGNGHRDRIPESGVLAAMRRLSDLSPPVPRTAFPALSKLRSRQ